MGHFPGLGALGAQKARHGRKSMFRPDEVVLYSPPLTRKLPKIIKSAIAPTRVRYRISRIKFSPATSRRVSAVRTSRASGYGRDIRVNCTEYGTLTWQRGTFTRSKHEASQNNLIISGPFEGMLFNNRPLSIHLLART